MDFLFKLAIFFLPFDNLFFAPSAGWATISPIIFFIYVIFNLKYILKIIKKYKAIFLIIVLLLVMSFMNFAFVGYNSNAMLDAIYTLFLGLCTLMAFEIYFVQKQNKLDSIYKLVIVAYALSLVYGWIQYFSFKFGLESINSLIDFVSKRNYLRVGRIQFSFTEPSFISMHIFGILLPLYFMRKNKKILCLIVLFVLSNLFFASSIRFLLDMVVAVAICLFLYFLRKKQYLLIIFLAIFSFFTVNILANYNPRVHNILEKGLYADSSLASRYFRINASFHGYERDLTHFMFGYGIGNSILPIKKGYDQAVREYKNSYIVEVIQIGSDDYYESNASFCFYTRLISEGGILLAILFFAYIFSIFRKSQFYYKYELLAIFLYLYLQFDSYAFYTLWILIFIFVNNQKQFKITNNNDKREILQ